MSDGGDAPAGGEPRRAAAAAEAETAWLRIVAADQVPGLVPLSRGHCLALAEAVLAAAVDGAVAAGSADRLEAGLEAVAVRVPAVAAWLESHSLRRRSAADAGAGQQPLLQRLAASVVLAGPLRPDGADAGVPGAEAAVLRHAITLSLEQCRRREDFDRDVGEARLEAMRELAYGAGHEINNPLANIATRAQALLVEESDPERRRRLATIVDQAFRARDMIGGLMLFARPPCPRRRPVDAGEIVAAVIDTVRGQAAARGVRLEYSPAPAPLSACIDRAQIEEAVRMIVVNALEATPAGGRVVLGTVRRTRDAGAWCEISVVDDGPGLSAEAARRAFDPFFSGREAGRGVGLGLPKAWRLVGVNGGMTCLEPLTPRGVRLAVLLPEGCPDGRSADVEAAGSVG